MKSTVMETTAPPLSEVEGLKLNSQGLCLPLPEDFSLERDHFSHESAQILKHHGVYQQVDREAPPQGSRHRLMVRVKLPGGRMTAEQYLLCDRLGDDYGQGRLRITSRQGLQFHDVRRSDLRPVIHDLVKLGQLTTLGAAGDVVRNVVAPPVADIDPVYHGLQEGLLGLADRLTAHFAPRTGAHAYLWVEDTLAEVYPDGRVLYRSEPPEAAEEPVYGETYLPRKFKIALATDFDNSVDVLSNDVGLIALSESDGLSRGYELVVGGGLGFRPNDPATMACAAVPLAFLREEEVLEVLDAVVRVFRENGNRSERSQARLKYLIRDWGLARFRQAVETRIGRPLADPKGIVPTAQPDYLGWKKQTQPGLNYLGVWVENGRICDQDGGPHYKSGLRALVERFRPEIRFTPLCHIILANIKDEDTAAVDALLDEYGIPHAQKVTPLRRKSATCPSLPLCPMACAEAERALPELLGKLESAGYAGAPVPVRISGCPNGCSRPRLAEIGILGQKKGRYSVYVGGNSSGVRLNEWLMDGLTLDELANRLAALFEMWKRDGMRSGCFGDWCHGIGVAELATRLAQSADTA